MKTTFTKIQDDKGTYIVEGIRKNDLVFSIQRFICTIQEQESTERTQELADWVLEKLKH